ncbi:MAG: LysM peptidoglycan-binding domain-containing protein [Bacteroidetes bacterium]|nr:LysM peptidoglycan-binding domain-containing protein [Bacteroidota bacterium]
MSLVKLKIEAFSDPACTAAVGSPFEVMFNPENYQRNYTVEYNNSNVVGENNSTLLFRGMKGSDLKLKLVADGSGVVPLPQGISNVDGYISKIKDLTYSFQGTEHRPSFLKIVWGNLSIICVCKTLNIAYNLFNPDGSTLRATIELGLSESIDFKTKAKEAQKSSPDLTHIRTVKAGDSLPLMTHKIYGDSTYYLDIARINGLSSVMDIKPGDQLYFPPIKK